MCLLSMRLAVVAVTLVLGWCPSRAQEVKKTKAFEYTAWMERNEGGLKARGYLGEKAERIDVPVSAMLTVEKFPVTYIKAHYEHATHVVSAEGFPSKKGSEEPVPSLVESSTPGLPLSRSGVEFEESILESSK